MSEWTEQIVWQASTPAIWWGVALVVLGTLGGWLFLAAVSANLAIAWLIVVEGLVHMIIARHSHQASSLIWILRRARLRFTRQVHCSSAVHAVLNFRIVASLDRKRLGTGVSSETSLTRGVFDMARRKPLVFAADAVSYGI
jgi:hypothetical protein